MFNDRFNVQNYYCSFFDRFFEKNKASPKVNSEKIQLQFIVPHSEKD